MTSREENIIQFGLDYVKRVERETKETGGKIVWSEDGGYKVIGGQIAFGNHQAEEDSRKPVFTTKHYKAIVEVVRTKDKSKRGYENYFIRLSELAIMFEKDNPKFDYSKFLKLID